MEGCPYEFLLALDIVVTIANPTINRDLHLDPKTETYVRRKLFQLIPDSRGFTKAVSLAAALTLCFLSSQHSLFSYGRSPTSC
jgi:hypothetical protein